MTARATARGAAAPRRREAPPAPSRQRPRAVPRSRPAARRRARARATPILIPLIALILGGIVWVNVGKLSLTNQTGRVMAKARSVEAETARLKSQLEQLDARVRVNAQRRLGLVLPPGDSVTYLDPPARP